MTAETFRQKFESEKIYVPAPYNAGANIFLQTVFPSKKFSAAENQNLAASKTPKISFAKSKIQVTSSNFKIVEKLPDQPEKLPPLVQNCLPKLVKRGSGKSGSKSPKLKRKNLPDKVPEIHEKRVKVESNSSEHGVNIEPDSGDLRNELAAKSACNNQKSDHHATKNRDISQVSSQNSTQPSQNLDASITSSLNDSALSTLTDQINMTRQKLLWKGLKIYIFNGEVIFDDQFLEELASLAPDWPIKNIQDTCQFSKNKIFMKRNVLNWNKVNNTSLIV